ncbi:glycosyltransferase [Halobacterium litoreum]|uniref:Glycosyltransferase n=1 Tax=Halobacterium litoreum TaxID=2039234 RepID=A0ABD5NEM4_9EURY|nr:glycosyltransferase [Halobacterium litoreum]UHH13618.1 glycosyltransferase [Halobacterium litoreum]
MRSVGIVVPAYDPDVEVLADYLDALQSVIRPARVHVELDDGDPETVAAIEQAGATVNDAAARRGKGAAVTAGFERLDTDVLAFADADGSTPAESFADVVECVREDGADLAVGSRRHPEADVQSHQTVVRRFLGDGFAWLASGLLSVDLHDYQCGAKALTAESWERVRDHLYEPGFAWDVELVAIAGAHGLRVAEVPIEWEDRPNSTVSPVRTPFSLFRSLVSARHRAKRLRDSRLHAAIAQRRDDPPALVDYVGSLSDDRRGSKHE